MGLFKKKAKKAELEGFKYQLKYGGDPAALLNSSIEHFEKYKEDKEKAKELLVKILDAPACDKWQEWSSLEIQDFGDACKESPVGKHVYMHTYGRNHPEYDTATHCLCCDKMLYRARNDR